MEIANAALTKLNDSELNLMVKSIAADERRLIRTVVQHIAEVDRRKLFLRMAYPSLFEYLTCEIGYSEGSAQRRIEAARLFQKVPEVGARLESGDINLSQISKLQRLSRQAKRDSGRTVSVELQKEILQKLQNQNSPQTDLILTRELQIEPRVEERSKIQRDESVRVELVFSKEEMELLKSAQQILSNQTGSGLKETLLVMAKKIVSSHRLKTTNKSSGNARKTTATVAVGRVSLKLRKMILNRDQCCQFKDAKTGKICGSKHFLEVDHIRPRHAGGSNSTKNLRALCRNHNQFRYKEGLQS